VPAAQPAPQPTTTAARPGRVASFARRLWARAGEALRQLCRAGARTAARAASLPGWALAKLRPLWPLRAQLLSAVAVGVAVGAGAYLAGPYAAAAAGWLGGFLGTLAVHAGVILRRLWPAPPARGPAQA